MAASEILGLFTSPQQYQQNQLAQFQNRAFQEVQLNPFQQAALGARTAGYQLGQGIGGALGGQDPQLQKIAQRQQILGMIDPSNPDSYAQAIQAALQGGDQEAAFLLRNEMMKVRQQGQQDQLKGLQITDILTERGLGMQQRGMQANALELSKGLIKSDGTVDETVYNDLLGYGQIGSAIIDQRLKATQGLESQKVENLAKTLFKADGTRDPVVEKQLSTTVAGRAVLKQFAPETRELKKGEKLLERTPSGTWKLITPEGQPAQTVSSDNAIQALIVGRAIHPSVLPYAQQLAKNFSNLDFEDQNVLMEKLTRLNSDAKSTESSMNLRQDMFESNKTFKEAMASSSAGMRTLQQELIQLKIDQAKQAQAKAADGKEIKIAESTKLSDQSVKVDKLVDIYQKFKPNFAGYPTNTAGDIAVWAASKSSDPNDVALVQWWQNYQEHVNTVRNDLFGSALTAPEKAEFERAMVTKGMNPTQAQTNLKRQADAALKAYDKLDKTLRSQGYSRSGLDILRPTGFGETLPTEVPVGVTVTVKKKGG